MTLAVKKYYKCYLHEKLKCLEKKTENVKDPHIILLRYQHISMFLTSLLTSLIDLLNIFGLI